ncbi:hypothetical protein B0H12DRAFT_1158335 [Mycena haematopus]|nr:hypothetical protein B0H12DRAFT_1158335 [Mycena haematopus]
MHRSILTIAPNLVEAHIKIRFNTESWPETDEVIIDLPALDRLYTSRPEVLHYIRTPVLQELALYFASTDRPSIVGELQSFLSRSLCYLRCLCLRGCAYPDTSIAILESIPSIIELRVMILAFGMDLEKWIDNLTVDGVLGSTVAPQLSIISSGTTIDVFDCKAYVEMVKSRWTSPNCALSRAMAVKKLPPKFETQENLRLLRDEGIDFWYGKESMASWLYLKPLMSNFVLL